jgi:hypothetical protein
LHAASKNDARQPGACPYAVAIRRALSAPRLDRLAEEVVAL